MSVMNKHADMRDLAEKNLRESMVYLAANKVKPNVTTLPSGLQYRVMVSGSGLQPVDSSTITYHYTGQLINGKTFSKSDPAAGPLSFKLNELLPGLQEGLKLMKVGGLTEFYVPPNLGYGDRPASSTIGPNVVLIFRIELLDVK